MNMTKDELVAKIKAWKPGDPPLDLHGANLRGTDLHGAYLSWADLHGANLHGADLRGADLRGTNLHGAYLHGAYLHGADLRGVDLRGTNLHGANLRGTNLRGCTMEWQSHALIGWRLYNEAPDNDINMKMLASFIIIHTSWCWSEWVEFEHPAKERALELMRTWVKPGDNAPDILTKEKEK